MRQTAKNEHRSGASKQRKRLMRRSTSPVSSKVGVGDTSVLKSKKAIIVALLQRPDGGPIGELTSVTGWQAHSVRAALTGCAHQTRGLPNLTHRCLTAVLRSLNFLTGVVPGSAFQSAASCAFDRTLASSFVADRPRNSAAEGLAGADA